MRPKLFLDTDVCGNVADKTIKPEEWERVRRFIEERYDYYISFITLKEILAGLAGVHAKQFERCKERLGILYRFLNPHFLPYPHVFAIRTVLGFKWVSRRNEASNIEEEKWLEASLKAVLSARSKPEVEDLLKDFVRENEPQEEHVNLLNGIRGDRIDRPHPLTWAGWILEPFGVQPTKERCHDMAARLDGAFDFSDALVCDRLKNPSYDPSGKHASDWGDCCQLFYLCDESMHMLTASRRDFRDLVKRSTQKSRILLWREFINNVRNS
jgi:hypothetical protein